MELGQAKLKVLNFVKLSCHIIPVYFYNNVYIHKHIYHFKIPQGIVIATRLWKYHGLVRHRRFFFTEYGPKTLSEGKTRDAAPGNDLST
jgi:hypothetical protein